MSLIDKHQ